MLLKNIFGTSEISLSFKIDAYYYKYMYRNKQILNKNEKWQILKIFPLSIKNSLHILTFFLIFGNIDEFYKVF